MNSEIVIAILISWLCLNAWVTTRIVRDELSSQRQRIYQTAFLWLVPILGIILVLYILRAEQEPGSGRYSEPPDPGDDFGRSGSQVRRLEKVLESEAASNGGTAASE